MIYDAETNTLTITLRRTHAREGGRKLSGIVLDCAAEGTLVGLAILNASQRALKPSHRAGDKLPATCRPEHNHPASNGSYELHTAVYSRTTVL